MLYNCDVIIYIDHDQKKERILPNYALFLDDQRLPKDVTWVDLPQLNWVVVRNYKEFISCIKKYNIPSICFFDHDLSYEDQNKIEGYKERTGYDCAKFLIEFCMKTEQQLPKYNVHSLNSVGKQNIISLLENFKNKQQNIDE